MSKVKATAIVVIVAFFAEGFASMATFIMERMT